jgi:hypothetical protein
MYLTRRKLTKARAIKARAIAVAISRDGLTLSA